MLDGMAARLPRGAHWAEPRALNLTPSCQQRAYTRKYKMWRRPGPRQWWRRAGCGELGAQRAREKSTPKLHGRRNPEYFMYCSAQTSELLPILQLGRERVDAAELPGPAHVVQELAVVEAVVVRRVALRVVRRRQRRRLVPVDGVETEEGLRSARAGFGGV